MCARATRPALRLWARRGYFRPGDAAEWTADRLAVIACHWIGDTLWGVQTIEPLRKRFPRAEIYAITKPTCVDLWNGFLPSRQVLAAAEVVSDRRREPVGWRRLRVKACELRRYNFDVVVDLTGNRYSAAMSFLLRPRRSIGFDGGELGPLYSLRVANAERTGEHLSRRPFRVIEPLLGRWDEPFAYSCPPAAPEPTKPAQELRRELGLGERPCCVLAPGAGWPEKRWAPAAFARVAELLTESGCAVVVVGSASERELCERVAAGVGLVIAGSPLGEIVGLLSAASAVVANDSGIGHLAAALGRRTAVMFTGETDPALCRPLGPEGCVSVFGAGVKPEEVAAAIRPD
ncbi:MAG: glycosyltransferase family 9 protein [Phycisphaerae bacterium]